MHVIDEIFYTELDDDLTDFIREIKEKEEIQVRIHFAGAMVATALHSQVVTVKFIGDSTKLR